MVRENGKRKQSKKRLKLGDKWQNTNRLFEQWIGSPMHPDTITKWLRQFLEDKNLPHITFHGLHHTHATLLIAQGLDVRTVCNRLGHAQTSTTLKIYAHAFARMDREHQINLIIFFIGKIQKNILKPIRSLSHKFIQKIERKKIL